MIAIDGSCLCSAGNISAIVGEAKSKKTSLTTALVAVLLPIALRPLKPLRIYLII